MLAAEGLVTMKMRRGAYVTEVNAKDLRDVCHLMAVPARTGTTWGAVKNGYSSA